MCIKAVLRCLCSCGLTGGVRLFLFYVCDASIEISSSVVGVKTNRIAAHVSMQLFLASSMSLSFPMSLNIKQRPRAQISCGLLKLKPLALESDSFKMSVQEFSIECRMIINVGYNIYSIMYSAASAVSVSGKICTKITFFSHLQVNLTID